MTFSLDLAIPATVLAISAHPDDSELQAGATLAKWAAAGATVHLFVCTDGSKGTWDASADSAALVETRKAEQRAALQALGSSGEVVFGGWVDGELESALEQRSAVALAIRQLKPTVVLGHDPWKRYRLHPDHRHAGLLAVEGIVAARDPHFFPEHGVPHHRPEELLLFEADEANHVEGIDDDAMGRKIAALDAHRSQHESTMFITDEDDGSERQAYLARLHDQTAEHGKLAGVSAGEAFRRMSDL